MQFDPSAFLDLPVTEAFERRPPIPAKDYVATIQDVIPRQWTSKDKYDANGQLKSGVAYDVKLELQIPLDVKEALGLKTDTLVVQDSIMLDMNAQGGLATEPGSNRQLRNYREALDMNKPGEPFRARDMIGRLVLLRIKHEDYQGNIQERPAGVAKIAS